MSIERHSGTQGFTLVEVLVALVVTSLLLAIVMNGALVARDRARSTALKQEALLLGRELVTRRSAEGFSTQAASGQAGDLQWETSETTVQADPRGQFVLAGIEVSIADARGTQLLKLETRQLKKLGAGDAR